MAIESYGEHHEAAVACFNQRMRAGGSAFKFPASCDIPWPPKSPGRPTYMEGFVALDGDVVRGGYLIKHQPFALNGTVVEDLKNLQLPLSEGSIDTAFSGVSIEILTNAMRRHRKLYALGMGGIHTPLPTVLASMGWSAELVPFFFRVVRPPAFLRNIRTLRVTNARRKALDVAAATGVAGIGIKLLHSALARSAWRFRAVKVDVVERFDDWADAIWRSALDSYALIALRDADGLNTLYPTTNPKPIRLRVSRAGRDLGWAVVFDTRLVNHKQFDNMRLGTIVDCLALPGEEAAVVCAATRHLRARGVDLIVSNQSHAAWCKALRGSGFLPGPSNYGFMASKALASALSPWKENLSRVHMTRGDGDGPIHI
ncbi:hypothetical protein [Novilysobacter antarcticus]|uniref:hypothetical protein n=1 Tax=Novilysobacter antarcticus TaxID=2862543 RepID=UPI001C99B8DD|nr:hypothetical protein [Lysobacter antarcticus]